MSSNLIAVNLTEAFRVFLLSALSTDWWRNMGNKMSPNESSGDRLRFCLSSYKDTSNRLFWSIFVEVHVDAKQVYFPGTEISSLVPHYITLRPREGKQLIKFAGTKSKLVAAQLSGPGNSVAAGAWQQSDKSWRESDVLTDGMRCCWWGSTFQPPCCGNKTLKTQIKK